MNPSYRRLVLACLPLVFGATLSAQIATHLWHADSVNPIDPGTPLTGAFNDTDHWDTGSVPNDVALPATDRTAVPGLFANGTYVVSITKAMFPDGLAHKYFQAKPAGGALTLNVAGNGPTDRLAWTIGYNEGAANIVDPIPFLDLSGGRVTLNLTDVALIAGSLDNKNTDNGSINVGAGSVMNVLRGTVASRGTGSTGSLTVTGAGSQVLVTDAASFSFGRCSVINSGLLRVSGNSTASLSAVAINSGGRVEFLGGTISLNVSSISMYSNNPLLLVDGATVTSNQTIVIGSSSGSATTDATVRVASGSITVPAFVVSGSNANIVTSPVPGLLDIIGGQTTATTVTVGHVLSSKTCPGLVAVSGGELTAGTFNLGRSDKNAGGLYNQTGGTVSVDSLRMLDGQAVSYTNYTGPVGTWKYIVNQDSTLRLTGDGMLRNTGDSGWLMDFTDASVFDTRGTFVVAPGTGVTSTQFLAFATDVGPNADAFAANTAIGTLDVSALDGDEKLTVAPAGNATTNALYINNLLGLDLATNSPTLKYLDSAVNIYYDGSNLANRYLIGSPMYSLGSGGWLVGVGIPEPSALLLLAFGSMLGLMRRAPRR